MKTSLGAAGLSTVLTEVSVGTFDELETLLVNLVKLLLISLIVVWATRCRWGSFHGPVLQLVIKMNVCKVILYEKLMQFLTFFQIRWFVFFFLNIKLK